MAYWESPRTERENASFYGLQIGSYLSFNFELRQQCQMSHWPDEEKIQQTPVFFFVCQPCPDPFLQAGHTQKKEF